MIKTLKEQNISKYSYDLNKVFNLYLFYFLAILTLIPSLTFSLVPAEVFPWALLFSLVYVKKIDKYFITIILLLFLSTLYGLLQSQGNSFSEGIRSFIAYLNSLFIFVLLISLSEKFIFKYVKIIRYVFYTFIILGFIQMSGILESFQSLFKFFIPRGSLISLSNIGDRGVTLLSSEPSRAAYEFLFIYLAYRITSLNKKKYIFYDLFVLIYILFVIKSAVGLFLLLGFYSILYRFKFIILTVFIFLMSLPLLDYMTGRGISILISIISSSSLESLYFKIVDLSGFRLISGIGSFLYSLNEVFGGGVGNWKESSITALALTSFSPQELYYFRDYSNGEWSSVRPDSYFFSILLDLGIIGTLIFISYIAYLITKIKSTGSLNIILCFLLYFILTGSVGNPIPWISLAICLKFLKEKNGHGE